MSIQTDFARMRCYLGRKRRELFPRNFHLSAPIGQLFLNQDGIETSYTLINFPSLFSPKTALPYFYDLKLFDSTGVLIGEKTVQIPCFGSSEIHPKDIFPGSLPELGIFTAKIRSTLWWHYSDKHLGVITPQFYALYKSRELGSVALVHPQTTLGPGASEKEKWTSAQLIFPKGLDAIRLYQINPNFHSTQTNLQLHKKNGPILFESAALIPALGARKIEWNLRGLAFSENEILELSATGLPAPNAKPLLFLFRNNQFTASHS